MNQIQIITDAGSDIIDCSRPDLTVLPMTIRFGDEEYLDGVNLTHRQFYEKMIETQVLPTTSQPSPYAFETAIRKIHEQGDIALIITISSKLSGTWQSANIAAAETGGEVYIVDSLNVAVGEKAIVEYALRMKDAGTDIHTRNFYQAHLSLDLNLASVIQCLQFFLGRIGNLYRQIVEHRLIRQPLYFQKLLFTEFSIKIQCRIFTSQMESHIIISKTCMDDSRYDMFSAVLLHP